MRLRKPTSMAALVLALAIGNANSAVADLDEDVINDYPTVARADYVFGCMQVNGNTRLALDRCACSIDVIASILPYEVYNQAETIMSVRQRGGENVAHLMNPASQRIVHELKQAQVEGEIRCF